MTGVDINSLLSNIGIVDGCFDGQEIDSDTYNWYVDRFEMCIRDGVPNAMFEYMHHANQREDINDLTKVAIMRASMVIVDNGCTK